ncbi:MAG: Ldh family oxidoreductase [Verrucomicrobiae bacterium]|nr:Ldh family oxidoreductase [Verrucomicrobiae bacterium]
MGKEFKISHAELVRIISKALADAGMSASVNAIEAGVMAEADLLGVPSHGVRMLPALIEGIRDGRVNANPQLKIVRERLATCVLDGDNGPGRFVSVQAMQHAIERAKHAGIGACLATRVSHWGRAHAYAYRAAQAGMIGICTTNAIPNMLAWGSTKPLLGNNPLAIAVPRGRGQEPIVLDMAMSQAAIGKIRTYLREGKSVPDGWGLDSAGRLTNDPAAILGGGRVLPFGDHKGAGLALFMELLTAALSGGLFSYEIAQADATGLDPGSSKLFLALNIEAFVDAGRFGERVQDLVAWLRQVEPGLEITLPGERGWQMRDQYLADGIPIHPEIVAQLEAIGVCLGEALGVKFPLKA